MKYYKDMDGDLWKVEDDNFNPNTQDVDFLEEIKAYLWQDGKWLFSYELDQFRPYTLISEEEAFIEVL